ncbi:MAG: metallophosphoesterase family protein [Fimbriiglobus sp.]
MMLHRRTLLTATAGLGILGTIRTTRGDVARRPVLRAAHITDVHITPEKQAPQGVETLFNHMLTATAWKPEVILNTGDTVMAIDGKVPAASAKTQMDLWQAATAKLPIPVRSALGNHDVWGGDQPTDAIPAEKKGFVLMTEALKLPAPYYSFDQSGWHFIALNSVCSWPDYGELSQEHFEWLKADLAKTKVSTPVCVLSHLPIVSVTSSLYGNKQKRPDGVLIPKVWQHRDCYEISEVFRKHPNVKLCLSGHMHTQDRCEYRGVWYICGGAASGAWWAGSEYGFPPCYGAIDLHADGTFEYRFIDYGWKVK